MREFITCSGPRNTSTDEYKGMVADKTLGYCSGVLCFYCTKKKRTISDAPPIYLNLKTHEQNKNTKIFHIAIHNTEKVYIFA